jgi:hypothetical protein
MRKFLLRAVAAAIVPLSACGSSTSPDQISVALSMGETVSTLRPFSSTTVLSSVIVLGAIATPDPCYNFAASVATTGSVIEAKVTATSKGGPCVTLFNQQNYTLTLASIPAGNWIVRVVHQRDSQAPVQQYETAVSFK